MADGDTAEVELEEIRCGNRVYIALHLFSYSKGDSVLGDLGVGGDSISK